MSESVYTCLVCADGPMELRYEEEQGPEDSCCDLRLQISYHTLTESEGSLPPFPTLMGLLLNTEFTKTLSGEHGHQKLFHIKAVKQTAACNTSKLMANFILCIITFPL